MNSIIGFSEALLNDLYGPLNDEQASRTAAFAATRTTCCT